MKQMMLNNTHLRPAKASWIVLLLLLLSIASTAEAQFVGGEFVDIFVRDGRPSQARNMLFGPDGNVYISSISTHQVLRYDGTTGQFLDSFVLSYSGGLESPRGMVFGPNGDLYVSSYDTDEVLRFDGLTGAFVEAYIPAQSSPLDGPAGLVFRPDGSLLVSSIHTDEVLLYDTNGQFQEAFISSSEQGLRYFYGMTLGPDGHLYVGSFLSHEVLRFDGMTGEFIDAFVVENTGSIRYPYTLLFGPDGNLYVGHQSNIVIQYDGETGHFMSHFASISTSEDSNVTFWVIAFDSDGLLYAYDNSSNTVYRFHGRTGRQLDLFITLENGNLNGPFGIAFAPDGTLYVTGFLWSHLLRIDSSGVINSRFFDCCFSRPRSPFDIIFDDRDRIYVSSFDQDSVVRFNALTGEMLEEYITPGRGGLDGASGMAIGEDRLLYVGSIFTDEILRYDLESGEFVDVFVSKGSGGLDAPHGIQFGPDGHLYVGSYFTDSILRFHKDTGVFIDAFVSEGSGGLDAPQDHVFGPDGNLYVTSLFTSEVLEYNGLDGGFVGAFVDANEGGLDGPRGLAFGPDNLLYVSSFDTDQVLRFTGPSEKRSTSTDEYLPAAFKLSGNFPNPFSESTQITYSLDRSTHVELIVFDIMGKQIDVLVSRYQSAGDYTITYTPAKLPSGLYAYRLQTHGYIETKQMMVVR